jgi:hypothetical protein
MSADNIVKNALADVPKSVAAGVVDMGSGLLLAVKTVESHPQSVIDLLASATKDLFEGDSVLTIEQLFKKARGVTNNDRYFQEVLVSSTNLWHYFGRLKSTPSVVMVVVCRGDVNLGAMLVKCRQICSSGTI